MKWVHTRGIPRPCERRNHKTMRPTPEKPPVEAPPAAPDAVALPSFVAGGTPGASAASVGGANGAAACPGKKWSCSCGLCLCNACAMPVQLDLPWAWAQRLGPDHQNECEI